MQDLEQRVALLKSAIAVADPRQAPDWRFEREVDNLIDAFYDDIGTIIRMPLKSLFDLFLIKVMYVGRGARDSSGARLPLGHAQPLPVYAGALVRTRRALRPLLSILDEMNERRNFRTSSRRRGRWPTMPSSSPASSRVAAGPDAASLGPPRPPAHRPDALHRAGRRYYRVAAEEELAAVVGQREVLTKLADHFPFYVETLSEMSQRYILGFDMDVVANKMLDAFNRYRETGAHGAHRECAQSTPRCSRWTAASRAYTSRAYRIINLGNLD